MKHRYPKRLREAYQNKKIQQVQDRLDRLASGGFVTDRDYYNIQWPQVTRQWQFGSYVHEVLEYYKPWIGVDLSKITV